MQTQSQMRTSNPSKLQVSANRQAGAPTPARPSTMTDAMEKALMMNDLSGLSVSERGQLYLKRCDSLGLNPWTEPFGYIEFENGKLSLYAKKDCTDQLRRIRSISVAIKEEGEVGDFYKVTAGATTPEGRTDEDIGMIWLMKKKIAEWKEGKNGKRYPVFGKTVDGNDILEPITGPDYANLVQKCVTKAKRRVTLSIVGLGINDESEIGELQGVRTFDQDMDSLKVAVKEIEEAEKPRRPLHPNEAKNKELTARMLEGFKKVGVEAGAIIEWLGCMPDEMHADQFTELTDIFRAIQGGAPKEQWFPMPEDEEITGILESPGVTDHILEAVPVA